MTEKEKTKEFLEGYVYGLLLCCFWDMAEFDNVEVLEPLTECGSYRIKIGFGSRPIRQNELSKLFEAVQNTSFDCLYEPHCEITSDGILIC